MVDGVVAANRVPESDAAGIRAVLLAALADDVAEPHARAA